MELVDRKRLARLMTIQNVTQRELAGYAGWRSHTLVSRLLTGEVKTVDAEKAVRIAHYLQVGTNDLFIERGSIDAVRNVQRKRAS